MTFGRILLATSNTHKLAEIRALFNERHRQRQTAEDAVAATVVELVGLDALNQRIAEPIEDQPSFEANAILKSRHYAEASGMRCLADDSGLEVDALGGEPGVRSARYAGVTTGRRQAVDAANMRLLLQKLGDTPIEQRTARFVCAMALCSPNVAEPVALVRGTVQGRILGPGDVGYRADGPSGRGENGFGYDPIFVVAELGRTAAELSPEQKNAISHRGNAARLMWARLVSIRGA